MKTIPITKENIDMLWALMDEYASAHEFFTERACTPEDHDWALRRMAAAKIGALHLLIGEPHISKECLESARSAVRSDPPNLNPEIPAHILEGLV